MYGIKGMIHSLMQSSLQITLMTKAENTGLINNAASLEEVLQLKQ
jgi:hypothetical protein